MKIVATLSVAALMAGCISCGSCGRSEEGDAPASKVSYLCVGMENSKRFGSCAGCELDAKRLTSLMRTKYGYSGVTLISEQATKAAVVSRLKEGISLTPEDGVFLFFYSGHGGQEALGGKEPDGADWKDEYLCLYDSHMLDDEIWAIVSQCKGRVFLYFDACHSATMYRSVDSELKARSAGAQNASALGCDLIRSSGFTFRPEMFVGAESMGLGDGRAQPRILCWSGCKEQEYSYGGNNGGMLTSAVINNWKKGMSYGSLWSLASKSVNRAEPTQNPVQTYVGDFKADLEAFR